MPRRGVEPLSPSGRAILSRAGMLTATKTCRQLSGISRLWVARSWLLSARVGGCSRTEHGQSPARVQRASIARPDLLIRSCRRTSPSVLIRRNPQAFRPSAASMEPHCDACLQMWWLPIGYQNSQASSLSRCRQAITHRTACVRPKRLARGRLAGATSLADAAAAVGALTSSCASRRGTRTQIPAPS
jgi:hypothetical protein